MAQVGSLTPDVGPFASAVKAVSSDDVWMVGSVGDPSHPTTLTEHWNGGTAWSVVPSPFNQTQSTATSVTYGFLNDVTARSSDDVWAGGYTETFTNGAGSVGYQALLIHWDGSSWTQDTTAPSSSMDIEGLSTTPGGHVIWATSAGSPYLLQCS
jgi:hypothetical protein